MVSDDELIPQLLAEVERLKVRQAELLATIVKVSQTTPFPDEIAGWTEQRAKMIAEVGTLRSQHASDRAEIVRLDGEVCRYKTAFSQAIAKLKASSVVHHVACTWCGEAWPHLDGETYATAEAHMHGHSSECAKNPARAELDAARAELGQLRELREWALSRISVCCRRRDELMATDDGLASHALTDSLREMHTLEAVLHILDGKTPT